MDPKQKLKGYRDSLDKDSLTEIAYGNWHIGALTAIVFLGFMLRYMPANGMEYLQAADPYYIFRMSQHYALEGNLPQLDFMRYFPYAAPTYLAYNGDFIIPALLYNSGFSLVFPSFLEFAQFYPALMGALSVLIMYFLGKEYFGKNAGLASAFFLAVTSAALRRTSAGFFEKEPIGVLLMLTSLLFFSRAWKKESWPYGIGSGLALGLFTVSWGGSQILWLIYPIIAGGTIFLDLEVRSLIAAITPTVLIAGPFATILLPRRFSLTSSLFLLSMAVLGAIWARYLVEEMNLVSDDYLQYFIPSLSVLGLFAAILSPLYSDWVARKIISFVNTAMGSTGGVIGGTVQENAPPGVGSLARNLGSVLTGNAAGLDAVIMSASPWVLMLFSAVFSVSALMLMLGKKYGFLEEVISGETHLAYFNMFFVSWMIFVTGLTLKSVLRTTPTEIVGLIAAIAVSPFLLAVVYFIEDEAALTISIMTVFGYLVGSLIAVFQFSSGILSNLSYLILLPAFIALAGNAIILYFEAFEDYRITERWFMIIPVVWIVASIFGATTRSRLVFLSAFAVSLGAGHAFSVGLNKLRQIDFGTVEFLDSGNLSIVAFSVLVTLVVGMNLASGYTTSQGIGGSPSQQIWGQSLDFMNDTPPGSVTLSWWDYGYHFQSLGRTASVADGGQGGYYSDEIRAVNMPLARYLNTTDRPEDREFIEQHSADYIWLDHSMIGKFSAVSQIANRNNSRFEYISQIGVSGSFQNALSRDGNETVIEFRGRLGRTGAQIFAPIQGDNTSLSLTGPATARFPGGQTADIGCVLTEEGKQTFEVENGLDFCIAEDPFYDLERGASGGQARAVLVPEKISDSTFVELYIQDGNGIDYAEKVPEASNGYIKMWEIEQ